MTENETVRVLCGTHKPRGFAAPYIPAHLEPPCICSTLLQGVRAGLEQRTREIVERLRGTAFNSPEPVHTWATFADFIEREFGSVTKDEQ